MSLFNGDVSGRVAMAFVLVLEMTGDWIAGDWMAGNWMALMLVLEMAGDWMADWSNRN